MFQFVVVVDDDVAVQSSDSEIKVSVHDAIVSLSCLQWVKNKNRRRKEGERGEASNLEKIYNVDDAVMTS